jgi:hypothetical protein
VTDDPELTWRDDPGWKIVAFLPAFWTKAGFEEVPDRPTDNAELAQPPIWASLYDERRVVATWWRPRVPESASAPER